MCSYNIAAEEDAVFDLTDVVEFAQSATSPVLKSSSKTAEALADLAFTELLARSDETKGKRDQLVRVTNHEELDRRFRALMIGDMDEGAAQVVIGDQALQKEN